MASSRSPRRTIINSGATQQFTATELSDSSTGRHELVTWSSSNTASATITSGAWQQAGPSATTAIQADLGLDSGSTDPLSACARRGLVGYWKFVPKGSAPRLPIVRQRLYGYWSMGSVGSPPRSGMPFRNGAISMFSTPRSTSVAQYGHRWPSGPIGLLAAVNPWLLRTAPITRFQHRVRFLPGMTLSVTGSGRRAWQRGYSVNCLRPTVFWSLAPLGCHLDKTQAGNNQTALYIDGVLQTPTSNLNTAQNTNSFGNNPIYLFPATAPSISMPAR